LVCGESLVSHESRRLASAILGTNSSSADNLASLIAARKWEEASRIQEWDAGKDVREYHLVRCPTSNRLGVVTLASRSEMWEDDRVEGRELLDEEDSRILEALGSDDWVKL
jgi:hypothetical protein